MTYNRNRYEQKIGDHLKSILPRLGHGDREMPSWPPDVFAICASLLVHSGTYCEGLVEWPPEGFDGRGRKKWVTHVTKVGKAWRKAWHRRTNPPKEVEYLWRALLDSDKNSICNISSISNIIMQLALIADEASKDVGSTLAGSLDTAADELFLIYANSLLIKDPERGASLCEEIDPMRLRVLPKMHTPQSGLTIRSLTHYLALVPTTEIIPEWRVMPNSLGGGTELNLLVIPYPFEVEEDQFRVAKSARNEMRNMPDCFGFFTFEHRRPIGFSVVNLVSEILETALRKKVVGAIHGVVLPEMAVTTEECEEIKALVVQRNIFFVCGHGKSAEDGRPGVNQAEICFPVWQSSVQKKHHRWRLDSGQIERYGIKGLGKNKSWWEYIPVKDRRLHFSSIAQNVALAVLICEDLARPDPVGDILRAVGPNLVIALLMDGPQMSSRWASRYATVLADDPGSSVLTVTSLGMALLSQGPNTGPPSRVIALWKDAHHPLQEIRLGNKSEAVVLKLSLTSAVEWSADGRSDQGAAIVPYLKKVIQVGRKSLKSTQ